MATHRGFGKLLENSGERNGRNGEEDEKNSESKRE